MADPIIVTIMPTRIWIEDDLFGGRAVMLQHEGCDSFQYAYFGYDYRYTSNSGTWKAATDLALSLGAVEPIERMTRGFPESRWWHGAFVWCWMRWQRLKKKAAAPTHGGEGG